MWGMSLPHQLNANIQSRVNGENESNRGKQKTENKKSMQTLNREMKIPFIFLHNRLKTQLTQITSSILFYFKNYFWHFKCSFILTDYWPNSVQFPLQPKYKCNWRPQKAKEIYFMPCLIYIITLLIGFLDVIKVTSLKQNHKLFPHHSSVWNWHITSWTLNFWTAERKLKKKKKKKKGLFIFSPLLVSLKLSKLETIPSSFWCTQPSYYKCSKT